VFYPLFVANGVTGIRDAGSEVPLDTLLLWRREILAGTRMGPPRQILSGQAIDEIAGQCTRAREMHTCVLSGDSADARHLVDSLKRAGADMLKTYGLWPDMYYVVAAEARRQGIPFGGHIWTSASNASDSGATILDHVTSASGGLNVSCLGDTIKPSDCQPIAERLARNGTWFVPTIVRSLTDGRGVDVPHAKPIFARFQARAQEFWAGSKLQGNWLRDSTAAGAAASGAAAVPDKPGYMSVAQRVGVPILAGTDAGAPVLREQPPGFSLHAELAFYVAEGLSPVAALRTATLSPAKMLHATDSLGTVAPGKLADLVLLDADPLADITNTTTIRAVVANGRYFDRAALDTLLADVQTKAKREGP
jgi:hypothetical protein